MTSLFPVTYDVSHPLCRVLFLLGSFVATLLTGRVVKNTPSLPTCFVFVRLSYSACDVQSRVRAMRINKMATVPRYSSSCPSRRPYFFIFFLGIVFLFLPSSTSLPVYLPIHGQYTNTTMTVGSLFLIS